MLVLRELIRKCALEVCCFVMDLCWMCVRCARDVCETFWICDMPAAIRAAFGLALSAPATGGAGCAAGTGCTVGRAVVAGAGGAGAPSSPTPVFLSTLAACAANGLRDAEGAGGGAESAPPPGGGGGGGLGAASGAAGGGGGGCIVAPGAGGGFGGGGAAGAGGGGGGPCIATVWIRLVGGASGLASFSSSSSSGSSQEGTSS